MMIQRRQFLAGLPCAALLASCGAPLAVREPWAFNPENREDILKKYVKISGALDERQLYLQYYGQIIAILPGQVQQPLFRLKGLVRQRWRPNTDGSYFHSNFDHGLFCDWDNGKVLTTYENPFTGEAVEPLHYKSGEIKDDIGLGEGQTDPAKGKTYRVVGNQVSVSAHRIGRDFNNPVKPELYPRASTGPKVQYSWLSTYFADARDVADPTLMSVEADHIWEFVTNFPAWMKMGQAPGFVMWRWAGKKFTDETQIDPYILSEVEQRAPGFMTVEKPWPQRSDGWTQYTREREIETQTEKGQ